MQELTWRRIYYKAKVVDETPLGVESCMMILYAIEGAPDDPLGEWMIPGTWQLN